MEPPRGTVQPGGSARLDLAHASLHIFCDPTDSIGAVMFSGYVEDLTILVDERLKVVEPEQIVEVTKEREVLICDDENVITLRHTNVLASFQREVSKDQT